MQPLSRDLDLNIKKLYSTFPISKSFDFLTRNLFLGETKAFWIGINGMCKMDVLQQIFSDLQNPQYMTDNKVENILNYMNARAGLCPGLPLRQLGGSDTQAFKRSHSSFH